MGDQLCVIPVYAFQEVGKELQKQWSLPHVLECLYPGIERHRRKQKFHAAWPDIQDIHRKLWPGIPPPKVRPLDPEEDGGFTNMISTSVFVATLMWGWMASKRSPASRNLAGKMFRAVVQLVCSRGDGVPLEFLKLESDGRGVLEKVTIGQDTVIACWSESMSEAVALAWDRAVLDHQRLFPSSSREHTCLFDFILWSLEPIPINNKDTKLKALKSFLSVPAMTLVTHVAKFLDDVYLPWALSHVADPGDDDDDQGPFAIHSTGGTKRRRTGTLTTNVVCAKAADRLFRGKVP